MKKITFLATALLMSLGSFAQQALFDNAPGVADMTKDEKGVWTFTSQLLSPELYSYNFLLDGVKIVDPGSVYITRDITSETNIFILSDKKGDCGDLYTVNEVPHGNVSKV